MGQWSGLYNNRRWRTLRLVQLGQHPLCAYCMKAGQVTEATVCDHVEPHKGDTEKFWAGPLQSLCKTHHDAAKQAEEHKGHAIGCSEDGKPIDASHPWNQVG